MYKYAVSVFFDSFKEITIDIVYAQNSLDAILTYLAAGYEDEVPGFIFSDEYINGKHLQDILEDFGIYVAVDRINDSRAGRSGTGLQTQSAQLNSEASFQ